MLSSQLAWLPLQFLLFFALLCSALPLSVCGLRSSRKSSNPMPRVPPLYPAPGTSPVADAIRQRRGARGLSPLDGTLLQSPAYASGWNQLLGAVRTKTTQHLPADVREIIILRVAVRNRAAVSPNVLCSFAV